MQVTLYQIQDDAHRNLLEKGRPLPPLSLVTDSMPNLQDPRWARLKEWADCSSVAR
ncbi:hypothetical protein D3C86_2231640 [compost metagenome]